MIWGWIYDCISVFVQILLLLVRVCGILTSLTKTSTLFKVFPITFKIFTIFIILTSLPITIKIFIIFIILTSLTEPLTLLNSREQLPTVHAGNRNMNSKKTFLLQKVVVINEMIKNQKTCCSFSPFHDNQKTWLALVSILENLPFEDDVIHCKFW